MLTLPNYDVGEIFYKAGHTIVYRGSRLKDRADVIIKTNTSNYPTLQELANLKHEYSILKEFSNQGIIKAYDLVKQQNRFFLVLEGSNGTTLREWLAGKVVSISDFFTISIQLTDILIYLHNQNIIHKDIKPSNILINPDNLQIKMIDFSISSRLSFETTNVVNPHILEGTLMYLSPEQTGRMNRVVDQRSDFYSLGITFYEMLTGHPPFQSKDPLELVYAHLAKSPEPVANVNTKVPLMLSSIISKMMAKSADERYISANGLKQDLLTSQALWNEGKLNEILPLGTKDIKRTLLISQKLYRRENETKELIKVFDQVCQGGASQLLLVSGSAGIGKSAFIQEIYKPLSRQKGYFIRGKFDILQRNVSYFGFIQAFKELMNNVLTESESELELLKNEILEAVGPNGQLVINLIPDLELLIGKQPPVAELQPQEAQNRFNFVFQRFINVFAKKEHPLVFFIDDLQWADHASLNLMEQLLIQTHYCLIIGAYRDNEVKGQHPLLMTMDLLKKQEVPITNIKLGPLEEKDVEALVQDSLAQLNTKELASLVFEKTQGNPFFINEFLKTLYRDKILFISDDGKWHWDTKAIQDQAITSNVIDLLIGKINKLPQRTQQLLALASCIGNLFDLSTISIISQLNPSETAEQLWPAVQASLIITLGSEYKQAALVETTDFGLIKYKFLHDRVQEAAYHLISTSEKKETHLKIGRLLLKNQKLTDELLVDLLDHFNYSLELITDSQERVVVAQLNVKAGEKAKASSAYDSAVRYFETAIALLPENSWEENYAYTFKVYRNCAECKYLVGGRIEEVQNDLMLLEKRAKTILDKAEIYSILTAQLTHIGRYAQAIRAGLDGLKLFGLNLPESPTQFDVLKAILKLKFRLMTTSARKRLDNLPPMTDPKYIKMIEIMHLLASPSYIYKQELHIVIGLTTIHYTIDHGYTKGSMLGFCLYLLVLVAKMYDYKEADFWAHLALKYSEKTGHIDNYTYFCLGFIYLHWKLPYRENFDYFKRSIKACIEEGDLNFLNYNFFVILGVSHSMGKHLLELQKECEDAIRVFKSWYSAFSLDLYLINCFLTGTHIEQSKIDKHINDVLSNPYSKTTYVLSYSRLGEVYYMLGEYDKGLDVGYKGMEVAINALGFTWQIDQEFYYGLALAACLPNKTGSERRTCYKQLKAVIKKFKIYADQAPFNYLDKYLFLCAELALVDGDQQLAGELYDKTIEKAKEQDFIHHVAAVAERASIMYAKAGREKLAKLYMQEAYYYYSLWGAMLKTKLLEEKHPEWFKPVKSTSITTVGTYSLDVLSILKANRALSSEIKLDQLLKKMLKILIENAGGQRGLLVLEKGNELVVEAESLYNEEEVRLPKQPIAERKDLPITIFAYVQRTLESVILSGTAPHQFSNDPYLLQYHPKSVLCTPIVYQQRLMGILYLENNAVEDVFTEERVEVLNLLSAQAAVSLENAHIYQSIEAVVEEHTQDLKIKNEELERAIKELQATQRRLIVQEKLASLGAITAGIAHEIKNPLNFVNNFAMVTSGKLEEIENILASGKKENGSTIPQLLKEAKSNLDIIVKQGTRADKIIDRMIEHSHTQETTPRLTDLNALLQECIGLALRRARIQDPFLNAKIETQFDPNIGNVQVVVGDLSTVFLNVLSNAFYYTNQKKLKEGEKYTPTIIITTKGNEKDNKVEISFHDNGMGITEKAYSKIFTPFYTTKPPGEGTGLGLSLSYDIIVHEHNGNFTFKSKKDEYTEFMIELPLHRGKKNK